MEYLKEFATQAEYDAFVESGQMKKPNVSLVNEPFGVIYNKYVPLGVFIQSVDGDLYTQEEWQGASFTNEQANGVAVITENVAIVLAKDFNINNKITWSDNTTTLIEGVVTAGTLAEAKTDFNGKANTEKIVENSTSGAAVACASYSFPNGEAGYLPAAGELFEIVSNVTEVNQCLRIIGGSSVPTYDFYFWTSTQQSNSLAWKVFTSGISIDMGNKTNKSAILPITRYEI